MISVWWELNGFVIMNFNNLIKQIFLISRVFARTILKLKGTVSVHRECVVFHHDKSKLHISLMNQQKPSLTSLDHAFSYYISLLENIWISSDILN